MENNKFSIDVCIFGIMLIAFLIFLHHNTKVKCERSGGFLVSERIGKSYRYVCVK